MRKFLRVLKWTGIILLVLIIGLTITVLLRQNITYDRPFPNVKASSDSAVIARGKHLVMGVAHCADCHAKPGADSVFAAGGQVDLTGGFVFDLPVGKIYTANITPDPTTGIGRLTDAEIARALRYGVHKDGTVVFNFMPFQNMSDEDMTAVISYLRAQPAVKSEVPPTDLNFIGKAVKAFLIKPVGPQGEVPVSVKPDSTIAYGSYLVNNMGNCTGCHTKRNLAGDWEGELLAGGVMEHDGKTFYPPNLTPDPSGRLEGWTEQHFINRFRQGRLVPGSPMPWPSYGRMSDLELKAIYRYLKSVKAAPTTITGKVK